MSTYYTAHRVFGLYFPTEEEARAFLESFGVEEDMDSLDASEPNLLSLAYLTYGDRWFVGYSLDAVGDVSDAMKLWYLKFDIQKFQNPGSRPQAHLIVDCY